MAKLLTEDGYARFHVEQDAEMMVEALNELDPFLRHSPSYVNNDDGTFVGSAA